MSEDKTIARRYVISGRVQGVYYRQSCRERALQLDLRGWVRNLDDGRVEALAAGAADALTEFEEWLWEGPPEALVELVVSESTESFAWKSFEVTG